LTDEGLNRLIEQARTALDIPESTPARAWAVHPASEAVRDYALVELGEPWAVVAVAAVDQATGQVLTSARLPGTGPHLRLGEVAALDAAGRSGGRARLVWRPSRQSQSMLYPLWEVRGADEEEAPVYVDHAGSIWPAIEPGGPGG
jgi:hypothetical protein